MRHGDELALPADVNITFAIGQRCMKQRHVGPKRRQQHNRVVVAERIVDNFPVRAMGQQIRADQPAQRHERHAFFCRLKLRVQRRAGRVTHLDGTGQDGHGKARRRTEFAEADGRVVEDLERLHGGRVFQEGLLMNALGVHDEVAQVRGDDRPAARLERPEQVVPPLEPAELGTTP